MNADKNLLHNMKITISKPFLVQPSPSHSSRSSDLHMGLARHISACPVGILADPGSSLHPPVPQLALWPPCAETFHLAWMGMARGDHPASPFLLVTRITAFIANAILPFRERNKPTWKRPSIVFRYNSQTGFWLLEIYCRHWILKKQIL